MFNRLSHNVARSVIGTLGAAIVATGLIGAAIGPAQANAAVLVSAPATPPLA